jgi:hypothetical protein
MPLPCTKQFTIQVAGSGPPVIPWQVIVGLSGNASESHTISALTGSCILTGPDPSTYNPSRIDWSGTIIGKPGGGNIHIDFTYTIVNPNGNHYLYVFTPPGGPFPVYACVNCGNPGPASCDAPLYAGENLVDILVASNSAASVFNVTWNLTIT